MQKRIILDSDPFTAVVEDSKARLRWRVTYRHWLQVSSFQAEQRRKQQAVRHRWCMDEGARWVV